jgi:hypothetical protein
MKSNNKKWEWKNHVEDKIEKDDHISLLMAT